MVRVFEKVGVLVGVLNIVIGKGSEIGDYIIIYKEINFINFIGSIEIGVRIFKMISMVFFLMELGGKDVVIVLEDVDLELLVKNIVVGVYLYLG